MQQKNPLVNLSTASQEYYSVVHYLLAAPLHLLNMTLQCAKPDMSFEPLSNSSLTRKIRQLTYHKTITDMVQFRIFMYCIILIPQKLIYNNHVLLKLIQTAR